MSHKIVEVPDLARDMRKYHGFFEDFMQDLDTTVWTTTATDAGGATINDAAGGTVTIDASDGTVADNDETYLLTVNETFLFADEKPIEFEANIQYTEANTDDANIFVGLKDAIAANTLVDDGAGPATSFSGFGFYKVDGGTNWNIIVSNGATQTTVELTAANSITGSAQTAGGAAFQRLAAMFTPVDSDKGDFTFWIDGVLVYKVKDFDYSSSPTEMQFGFGVKNGDTNEETLDVDYCWCYQTR